MEQSTEINSISCFNEDGDNVKSSNLTLYKKTILIEDEFHKGYLCFRPETDSFRDKYKTEETLYECFIAPTRVYLASEIITGKKYAIKEISKPKLSKDVMYEFVYNELAISKYLSNFLNSVVKVYEYYEEESYFFIVMELCDRPNFFEELLENRYCAIDNEKTLKIFAYDILTSLKEMHCRGIIHCDVKPQNFLLFNNTGHSDDSFDENIILKLTDFGLCHYIDKKTGKAEMKISCGTYQYKAPEVQNDSFVDCSIDMWSFGVSLYKMAVAYFPTDIKKYQYGSGPIPFREKDWASFTFNEIRDLIESCLQIDPLKRITSEEALKHVWFETL